MNNKLLEIQEMLMKEMKRIDNEKMSMEELNTEIYRSNALSNNAMAFIKTINVNLRIKELANKMEATKSSINKELGIEDD